MPTNGQRAALTSLGLALIALIFPAAVGQADDAAGAVFAREDVEFFESAVRPLLVEKCQECHGAKKQEANLRLDSRAAVLAGGENGPAAVPGEPEKSRLISAVHYADDTLQMPPKGKLDQDKIDALTRWVKLNLPWSAGETPLRAAKVTSDFQIKPEDREFWSLRPIANPLPSEVRETDWPQTGVDAFILAQLESQGLAHAPPADKRALLRRLTFDLTGLPPTPDQVQAFASDESSKALAQVVDRLLDSPQYGERMARLWLDVARYGEDQAHTFEARRYPNGFRYRDWVVQAFNRDLPYDQFVKQQIAADLYEPAEGGDPRERLAALGYFACGPVYYGDKNQLDQIADRIDTLTRGFLGLTVACARCHDHKFDPISTVDYYALAGVFASTQYEEVPLVSDEEVKGIEKGLSDDDKKKKNREKKYPFIHALKDSSEPKNLKVHIRGNAETLGAEAPRRFMEVLCEEVPAPFQQGSGRKELAEAIASADNPLTARVIVNRLWQQHFGKGLARTTSNFGHLGERPTHPELLDYLASRLIGSGWSLKAIHREIVLSATYQQSAVGDDRTVEADPENLLCGRGSRRRLEVEMWRDAMLAVSDQLDVTLGGKSSDLAESGNRRRTLYGFVSRHELNPLLRLFDFPDPNITSDQRPVTTVPLQQLFVLNSEFLIQQARALAERLQSESADDEQRIRFAYDLLYARPPKQEEIDLAKAYLGRAESGANDQQLTRWERYAQALLSANEFLHVD